MIIEQSRNILLMAILVAMVWSVSIFYTPNKNEVTQEAPKYSKQEMEKAIIYFNKSGEFDEALLLAKEYVLLYPDDLDGWNHRGYAYYGLGDCIEAFANFYHASVNGNKTADALIAETANSETCKSHNQ